MARITARDIEVIYPVVTQRGQSLRLKLMHYGSGGILAQDARGIVNVRALSGISFDIREGDRVGLVGRNGAGKSTLLRVLAGIYHPSRGELRIDGEVSAILGLGLGIDEELSGHETIDYALMMRGVPRDAIPALHDEIAAFTELEDYLQLPVRTYSSGMKIRLAFGVATSRRPDVLLLDEGIGAGDAFFLQKARRRAESFVDDASILVIASHSDDLLLKTCNKGLLLDRGEIIAAGDIGRVVDLYRSSMSNTAAFVSQENERQFRHFISSGAKPGYDAANAFDGSVSTHWASDGQGTEHWIGERFEQPIVVTSVTLQQWSGDLDNIDCVDKIAIQTSDDVFLHDIKTIAVKEVQKGIAAATYSIPNTTPAQAWRIIGLQSDGSPSMGFSVIFLEFNGKVAETGAIGSAGSTGKDSSNEPVSEYREEIYHPSDSHTPPHEIKRDQLVETALDRLRKIYSTDPNWRVPPLTGHQSVANERRRKAAEEATSPTEVIRNAQMPALGFEARRPSAWLAVRTDDIEDRLAIDFPHYASKIALFSDIPNALPQFVTSYRSRYVSWPMYTATRMIMRCGTHIPKLDVICEIGCGNGATARLLADNPIIHAKRFILIDAPESLFFAEVLLRSHFGESSVAYVEDKTNYEANHDKLFILVPYSNVSAILEENIDLVVSLFSFQELDANWLQFTYRLIDALAPSHIYSLNYFGTPIAHMRNALNFWSPRLSSKWQAYLMLANAHRAPRSFAEIIFSRRNEDIRRSNILSRFDDLERKAMSQQNFLEMMDCVRELPDPSLAGRLLKAVHERMGYLPGEARVLYEILLASFNEKRQFTSQDWIKSMVWFSDSCLTYKIPGVVGFTEAKPVEDEQM